MLKVTQMMWNAIRLSAVNGEAFEPRAPATEDVQKQKCVQASSESL
jgi:hypothetical protein